MVTFPLALIPFSRPDTYLKITGLRASVPHRLVVGTARAIPFIDLATKDKPSEYYEIALFSGGKEVTYTAEGTPACIRLRARAGDAVIAFADAETVLFDARGVSLRFLPCHSVCTLDKRADGSTAMVDYRGLCTHVVRAGAGTTVSITPSNTVHGTTGPYHDTPYTLAFSGRGCISGAVRFSTYGEEWSDPLPPMEVVIDQARRSWQLWERRLPSVDPRLSLAAKTAWYVMWSCTVPAAGLYTRRAVLMSNHWMNQVWSWDNCFNAIALAKADPALAFDQLRLVFDRQSPNGMFPEPMNDFIAHYGYVKPPVYGWTMLKLSERLDKRVFASFAREAYEPIARQTAWWYRQRDNDNDGMCEYHHGNDSGWDNATMFDQGYPTEGSDLAAHLVLQCEGLAFMARAIGKPREAARWTQCAALQHKNLLAQGVRNNRFFSPLNGRKSAPACSSLLNYIPMVLGGRLPGAIRRQLVKDLSPGGPYLTDYGLASEAPSSPKYKPNGYWRGPIWAPSTYLIFDGLVHAGETDLAKVVAHRFCMLCAKTNGMYENYDALTGEGLCCPAYTWTSAVFLLLAEWLAEHS